jgi:hypothetical protein
MAALWPVLGPDSTKSLVTVAARRPAKDRVFVKLVDALRHNGRPIDANNLLDPVATLEADNIAATLAAIALTKRDADVTRVLAAMPKVATSKHDSVPPRLTEVLDLLAQRETGTVRACLTAFRHVHADDAVTYLLHKVATTYPSLKIAQMLKALADAEENDLSHRLTDEVAERLKPTYGYFSWHKPNKIIEQLEDLYGVDRRPDSLRLVAALAHGRNKLWQANAMERVASSMRRSGRHGDATALTDMLRPKWRREAAKAVPAAIVMLVALFMLGRAFPYAVAGHWLHFIPFGISAALGGLLLLGFEILLIPRFTAGLGLRKGWPAADQLLYVLMSATVVESLAKADWLSGRFWKFFGGDHAARGSWAGAPCCSCSAIRSSRACRSWWVNFHWKGCAVAL